MIRKKNRVKMNNPLCKSAKFLCKKGTCQPCFERSFASHEKSKYWNYQKNENIDPYRAFKKSSEKYWFTCQECKHDFQSTLRNISSIGCWCPFCVNKKLCENEKCNSCFNKSFAFHEKSQHWNYEKNGDVKPRNVFKNSRKKVWFTCPKCKHDFQMVLYYVSSSGHWCSFCTNQKLCDDTNCQYCYEKSFMSHPNSKFWNYSKNKMTPRSVFKKTDKKFWFVCVKGHDFEMRLGHISSRGYWCAFCRVGKEFIYSNDES